MGGAVGVNVSPGCVGARVVGEMLEGATEGDTVGDTVLTVVFKPDITT